MIDQLLAVFAPLLGACVSAPMGPGMIDTHCFETLYDGAHVQDQHVVTKDGKAVYSGVSTYSATPDGLFFVYVNSTGGSGTGTATVAGSGFGYKMTMRGTAKSAPKPYSGKWTIRADGYDAEAEGEETRRYVKLADGTIR